MVLPLSCFRRIQFGAFGGKGVTEHFIYFCPRFQNDTGSEVWGFCVFYRQVAGIGFPLCCKWRSVSAHRSLTRLIHFLFKFRKYVPHALKGQKLLAQGIALGIQAISKAPCKGKSFVYCLVFEGFCPYRATDLHPSLPQGDALG